MPNSSCVTAHCFRYQICAHLKNNISSVLAIYEDQLKTSLNEWNEIRCQKGLEEWIIIYFLLVNAFKSMTTKGVNELQRIYQTVEMCLQGHQAPGLFCCGCMPAEYGRHFQDSHMKDLCLLIQAGEKGGRKQRGGWRFECTWVWSTVSNKYLVKELKSTFILGRSCQNMTGYLADFCLILKECAKNSDYYTSENHVKT